MIPRISLLRFFLVVLIPLTTIILASSATAFVVDVCIAKRSFCHSAVTPNKVEGRKDNRYSYALAAAGGFGKAPTGKSSSSGKKKAKKKPKKNNNLDQPWPPPQTLSNPDERNGEPDEKGTETTKALLEWLDEEEVEGLEGVEIGFSKKDGYDRIDTYGHDAKGLRGVFARQDFQPGEYIMAVPFVTTLLVDEDFEASTSDPSAVRRLRAGEPEVGLQFWRKFAQKNNLKYKAFLDCLPNSLGGSDPNFDATPDFWSDEEIHQLEIPKVIEDMLSRKQAITELVDALSKDDFTDLITGSSSFNIEGACWIVQSRAFTTYKKAIDLDGNTGLLSRVVLMPFIDMINHASRKFSNAEMQVVETKAYDESLYALVATQPIRKGTELKICYGTGEETALELFCKYGFLPEVENRETEKAALQNLLEGVTWSTSLEEDQVMLATEEGNKEPMRSILSLRIYAKSLLV